MNAVSEISAESKTFEGNPCRACGATLRYKAGSKACVACARKRMAELHGKRASEKVDVMKPIKDRKHLDDLTESDKVLIESLRFDYEKSIGFIARKFEVSEIRIRDVLWERSVVRNASRQKQRSVGR